MLSRDASLHPSSVVNVSTAFGEGIDGTLESGQYIPPHDSDDDGLDDNNNNIINRPSFCWYWMRLFNTTTSHQGSGVQ